MDDADVYSVCRLCMCGDNGLLDIMKDCDELEFVVVDTVKDLLQLDIVEEEGHPWNVCSSCLKQLSDFLEFKKKCQRSKIEFENRQQLIDHSYSMLWDGQNQGEAGQEAETMETVDDGEDGPVEDVTSTSTEVEDCTDMTNADSVNEATQSERVRGDAVEKIKSGNLEDAGGRFGGVDRGEDTTGSEPNCGEDLAGPKLAVAKILGKDISTSKIFCCQKIGGIKGWKMFRMPMNESYRCWHCQEVFEERLKLGKHMIEHFQSRVYQWEIKSDISQNGVMGIDSQGMFAKKTFFRCSYCVRSYEKRCDLTRHALTHFKKTSHKWDIDSDPGKQEERQTLMKTLGGRTVKTFFRCLHCKKPYDRRDELGKHVLTHFQTSVHTWEIKSGAFDEEEDIPEVVVNSDDTDEESNGLPHFEEVVDSVTNEPIPEDCNVVIDGVLEGSDLIDEYLFKKEQPTHHQCSLCGKSYMTKHSLLLHQRNKCNTIRYHCDICNREYKSQAAVKSHKNTIHSNILYQCSICSNTYNDKSYLRKHLMIHTGQRPYRCPTCDKAFISSSHMKAHMQTHTNEKPYQCHVCGKRFTRKKAFDDHSNEHTGLEPYSCNVCGMTFSSIKKRRRHRKVHQTSDY